MTANNIYTAEQKRWLKKHRPKLLPTQLAQLFNERFGTQVSASALKGMCTRMGLKAPSNGRYKAGGTPWNKGMKGLRLSPRTEFSDGYRPHNTLPIGSECRKNDDYWYVKTADPNQWTAKHRLIWEAAHGPKPANCCLIFLDGNLDNFALDNIHCVKRAVLLQLNRNKYKQAHPELKPAVLAVSKLESAIFSARIKNTL